MTTSLLFGDYDQDTDNLDIIALGKILKPHFRFQENRNLFNNLPKPKNLKCILNLYGQQDYLEREEESLDIIKKAIQDVSPDFLFKNTFKKISKNQALEYDECINTYHIIKGAITINKKLKIPGLPVTEVQELNKNFKSYFKEIENLFDLKSNNLITYKHPVLKEIDKKIQDLEKDIRSRLGQISNKWSNDELLQQNNYDVFDEKYVLPVRSDRYSGQLGRIIYRSKGGGVLYVEPVALRELSNSLEESKAALEREIYKLLKNLCDELFNSLELIRKVFDLVLYSDAARGRKSAADSIGLNKPHFSRDLEFNFHQIFHPLIEEPIKNDLSLSEGQGMLISGPNTGGKTVLLKSICLCLIFPHHGLFVPAKEANFFFTDQVHFMSHDNQSLSDGLSSFSSEAMSYLKAMEGLASKSLVFIDEIFNTTSSYEASLLAMALIRFIKDRGAITFISSHHETLKEHVYNESALESAHMGFKKGTSTPTYVLHQGSPGRSFAREVFLRLENEKLGRPLVSKFLENTEGESDFLSDAIQSADELKEIARKQIDDYKELEEKLKQEQRKIKSLLLLEKEKLQEDFDHKWRKVKKEALDLTEKIKKGEVKNIIKVSENLNKISKKEVSPQPTKPQNLKGVPQIGDPVMLKSLGVRGKVIKIKGEKAYVEAGKIKSWVAFSDLGYAQKNNQKEERVKVNVIKDSSQRNMKLDARGMRRDEFLKLAEEHILDVINGDIPFVDIIHGHGDGILKSSLTGLLKKYRDDISYGFIEGNMGTTRIELNSAT